MTRVVKILLEYESRLTLLVVTLKTSEKILKK
jgi:hypothetical protein